MRILVALAFLSIFGLDICRANIGETEAQCVARYGAESDIRDALGNRQVGDKAASFTVKLSGVTANVRVTFLNGRSCHESFSNADSSRGLSELQMKAILASQSAGQKWEKGKAVYRTGSINGSTFGTVDWLRDDGATAKFWMSGKSSSQDQSGQVDLSTRQYANAQREFDHENGDN